jgi:hypothetical protein
MKIRKILALARDTSDTFAPARLRGTTKTPKVYKKPLNECAQARTFFNRGARAGST